MPSSEEQPLERGLQGHFRASYNTVGALSLSYDNCLLYLRKQGSLARNSTKWLSFQHWGLLSFSTLSWGLVQLLPFETNCYFCLWLLLFLLQTPQVLSSQFCRAQKLGTLTLGTLCTELPAAVDCLRNYLLPPRAPVISYRSSCRVSEANRLFSLTLAFSTVWHLK